ncbi:MAG: hypothetical protein EBE86_011845 [Hormoscilla sp. GUM202]|nr:hypothetical protein [Hormoscilla sp. GUM202]
MVTTGEPHAIDALEQWVVRLARPPDLCSVRTRAGAQFLIGIPILQPQQLLRKPTTS